MSWFTHPREQQCQYTREFPRVYQARHSPTSCSSRAWQDSLQHNSKLCWPSSKLSLHSSKQRQQPSNNKQQHSNSSKQQLTVLSRITRICCSRDRLQRREAVRSLQVPTIQHLTLLRPSQHRKLLLELLMAPLANSQLHSLRMVRQQLRNRDKPVQSSSQHFQARQWQWSRDQMLQ